MFETKFAKPFVRPSLISWRLYLSTQAEEGIEEGVEGVDDTLIDSLIDAVYFNDSVLEKDVFDHVRYGCLLQECQAQSLIQSGGENFVNLLIY